VGRQALQNGLDRRDSQKELMQDGTTGDQMADYNASAAATGQEIYTTWHGALSWYSLPQLALLLFGTEVSQASTSNYISFDYIFVQH
jgi:hypothetical protein